MSGTFKIGSSVVQPDLNSLVCNGMVKHLEPKMMEVLVCLAEKQGEVVSKEQLIRAVWTNTFVTDDVLTRSISELRRALRDDPKEQKVIQTIPKKGYRLVIAVEPVAPVPPAVLSSAQATKADMTVSTKRRGALIVTAAVVVAAAVAASAYFLTHRVPKVTSRDPIVIADFVNTTGDLVFDDTLRQGLMAQLEQSPYLNILSDEQIAGTLGLMTQSDGTRLTHELARQVCQRTGGTVVLDGSIAQIGSQYQLILTAFDCSTEARLASAQGVASDKNHVLAALSGVASAIRPKLGESLASIQEFNTPLEQVTTPSLEALQAYTVGWKANLSGEESAATASFERAISLDPNFAMAYATLGRTYGGLGESGLATANAQKAYELRGRVSEQEKFYISSHYEMNVTGDLEKANQVFKLWAQIYPWDVVPVGELGWGYTGLGQYEESLAAARRALELAPNREMPYELLAYSYLELDRLDEAVAIIRQGKARGIDSPPLRELSYALAYLRGDTAEMARDVAWAAGKPGTEDVLTALESDAAAHAGHFAQANDLTPRAVASAGRAEAKERAADYVAEAALREALVKDARRARIEAVSALPDSSYRDAQFAATLALSLAGSLAKAQELAENLAKHYPQDTVMQFNYLPSIRAAIALGQESPAKAIAYLQVAVPYELGTPYFSLGPVYMRGEAYLAAHRGSEAAAEFQKILDHRGIAMNAPGPIIALARLGLARAYAMQGDSVKARTSYRDFLTLWKDADPDIPILKQAKAEYAKLW